MMKNPEQEIETILRMAPPARPPTWLKSRLLEQIELPTAKTTPPPRRSFREARHWLRRWWPILAPASLSLACAVAFTVQQGELRKLDQTLQNLRASAPAAATALADPAPAPADSTRAQDPEVSRLRALATQLNGEIAQLEQMRSENQALRNRLAAASAGGFTAEETADLAAAREHAENIRCVNNMKQLGLACKIWAVDNKDVLPARLLDMTNEMATPKILVCPADHGRSEAPDWSSFSAANCSYEYLAANASETEPSRVMFKCPVHGNVTLCDGSVQSGVLKSHPEWLVTRDGKLYLEEPQASQAAPAASAPK